MSDAEYNSHLARFQRLRDAGEPVTADDMRIEEMQRREEERNYGHAV